MCEQAVSFEDVCELEDLGCINISKRKLNKTIEQLVTNKYNKVVSFVIDDFMMNIMWDIYFTLKKTKIARTTKRQVDSLQYYENKCVQSMIIGKRWNCYKKQYEIPPYDKKHGDYLFKLIKKLCDYICTKYDLDLNCNTATINKNFQCSLHKDSNNIFKHKNYISNNFNST